MSIRDKSRNLGHRLKKATKVVASRRKKPHANGLPSWLGIGVSPDGTRRVYFIKLKFPRPLLLAYLYCRRFTKKHKVWTRVITFFVIAVLLFSIVYPIYQSRQEKVDYEVSSFSGILDQPLPQYADKLEFDNKGGFTFNKGYTIASGSIGDSSAPKITASFASAADDSSITVNDPVNNVGITLTPRFSLADPRKKDNRVIYPILGKSALKVYSMKASGVKEDILLRRPTTDKMQFEYDVKLPEGVELRAEGDGSLAAYGVTSALLGNVSTGSDKDAELLTNARKNGEKSNLLFKIPAPFIVEANRKQSSARAWFSVDGTVLTLFASGLKSASYPLSIDPTIYVETASQLMRGNNETNVDFDTTNELIQKSQTTGARIDGWADTTDMTAGLWDHSVATAGGYVYRAGGRIDPTVPYIAGQQSTLQGTAAANFTMAMPTVRPANDLYVAIIAHKGTGAVTQAGWTVISNTREVSLLYRIGTNVSGGNEAASYTFTGASAEYVGTIVRIKNFNSGSPISGTAGAGSSASAAVPVFPTTTPAVDATLVIRAAGINADTPSEYTWLPNGHSRIYSGESSAVAASSASLVAATLDQPPLASVATGTQTLVSDGLLIDTYGAVSVAIAPATVTAGYQTSVEWARFNDATLTIDSPNPGAGTCSGWCNDSVYNLPAARVGMSMVAYNGFLYALGGTPDGTAASATNTVWIARLGANGEPQLWNPIGGTPTYWYASTQVLPASLSYASIVAYKNRLYLTGGRDTSGNSLTAVREADFLPTGDIGAWTTTGMQDLTTPLARFGHSVHVYNDVMYVIGGNNSGTLLSTTYMSKIDANGQMSAWQQTSSFTTGRSSFGGQMTGVLGAYIYLAGGCTALTSGYCSTISQDVQLASINADGTLAPWNPIITLSNQRIGYSFVAWQGGLYRFGGCSRQNTSTGVCYSTNQSVEYGAVNPSGDASTVSNSTVAGRGTCQGSSPTNCNLPDPGDTARLGGQMSSMTVINNGYVYIIGGCATAANPGTCSNMSGNISYASISSTGVLTRPLVCSGSYGVNMRAPGVITQSGTAVTGVGTDFDSSMSGRSIIYEDNAVGTISGAPSSTTTMTMAGSKAVTTQKYSFGITKSGTTITGGDGRWTSSIVGSTLVYDDGTTATVSAFTSSTQITVTAGHADFATAQRYGFETNWCVDSTNQINGTSGVGAAAAAVFNNTIYVVGGTNGSGTWTAVTRRVLLNADGSLSGAWTNQNPGATAGLTGLPTTTFPGVASGNGIGYSYSFVRANPSSAGTVPGNLYVIGGCTGGGGVGCTNTNYSTGVYKCNISTDGSIATNSCTTTGQLQIDPDGSGAVKNGQGIGLMAGSVYANKVYLVGGACEPQSTAVPANPCGSTYAANRKDTIYAAIDDSNNIVDADSTNSDTWELTSAQMSPIRRRGISFGYNGYIYSLAGYSGTASLQDLLFAKVNVSTGNVEGVDGGTDFDSSGVVVTPRWDLRAIVSNGYVYALGGCGGTTAVAPTCSTYTEPTVQTFQLYNNDSGTPVNYGASANQFGTDRMGGSSTIYNGYLYVAGGCTSVGDCSTATDSVQYAAIDSYGAIGTWSSGGNLPAARAWGQLENVGGTLYYIGGQESTATNEQLTVYYTSSIIAGNPTWAGTAATNGLPAEATKLSASVWDNRIYVTGGLNGSAAATAITYISPKLSSGGNITSAWTTSTSFDVARSGHTTIAYANNLYVIGGIDNSGNYLNDVQFATIGYKTGSITQSGTSTVTGSGTAWTSAMIGSTIQYRDGETATILTVPSGTSMTVSISKVVTAGSGYTIMDGSVAAWSYTTSLPEPIANADGFAANGYMYLIGGRSATGDCVPNTLLAPVSANTTIASGNNATGIGEWYETNVKYTGDRYGNAVSYANGKVYVTGGACESFPTVSSINTFTLNSNDVNHNLVMPATVDAGDLLVVLFTNDGNATVTTPAGWTAVSTAVDPGNNVRGSVFAIDAVGTEDGATVNFVTSAAEQGAAQIYRIPVAKWEGNIASVEAASFNAATTTTPNPPSLNPAGWGNENTLWLSYVAGGSYTSVTTYPANHTNGLHTVSSAGAAGASVSSTQRVINAASEDPGTYTSTLTSPYAAFTIGVRPATFAYTGANRAVQTSLYSQPQVASYSRLIDTDIDVFPNSWLLNGLDNSIGARWQTRYRTMHDNNPLVVGGTDSPAYDQGTITQSGTAITGTGTTTQWTSALVGGTIVYADLSTATVVAVGGSGSITSSVSKTIASPQTYAIYQLQQNPFEDCGTTSTMPTMTTFGYETNYGDTTLGDVATYTPRNGFSSSAGTITQSTTAVVGSGTAFTDNYIGGVIFYADGSNATIVSVTDATHLTVNTSKTIGSAQAYQIAGGNINCARFYYFYLSIDASQTFGYPEDVNRGPTIADLSLFFTSDPSRRLRHGKTFSGGELQPLDTPCRQTVDAQCPLP